MKTITDQDILNQQMFQTVLKNYFTFIVESGHCTKTFIKYLSLLERIIK